jgi:hypothetical protein
MRSYHKKIIWDDDGNVVLASAYGRYMQAAWSRMSWMKKTTLVTKLGDIQRILSIAILLIAGLLLIVVSPLSRKFMQKSNKY